MSLILGPTPDQNYTVEMHYFYYPPTIVQGQIISTGNLTGGTLYNNGVHQNIPLSGGSGNGVTADILVAGQTVTACTIKFGGNFYAVGDVLTVEGSPLFGPDDVFSFKLDGVSSSAASVSLKNIKVVPNPYIAHYSAMVETGEGESILEFQKVPDKCTIRIYTLAGDLVKTIDHDDGSGTARWDLMSKDNIQVASGIYLFHVESSYGEHLGRFAVIR